MSRLDVWELEEGVGGEVGGGYGELDVGDAADERVGEMGVKLFRRWISRFGFLGRALRLSIHLWRFLVMYPCSLILQGVTQESLYQGPITTPK